MEQSVRLGKIGGIPLGMHWSVLVIFFLIAWELSTLVLPADVSGAGQGVYWAVGVSTALLFYASLLALVDSDYSDVFYRLDKQHHLISISTF